MRVIIKGGVWKNTEDEILKAAVQKYGKNQWARISSLLTRKTPKQCKARWQDWLDPSIKKTEFSKLEDEKLLHLAKLMPTQWRTIAPIVGRTAAQCLERYQQLLDEAETGTGEGASGAQDEGARKLRPGEIDPDPETKPPRPDPVDMDEDEKEMLSEARARLANTQGKKAKRKARERQLEEARRLATMQKRRELKAAGIEFHGTGSLVRKKRKRGISDYNQEIPFQKKPALGFFDTTEEIRRSHRESHHRDKGKRRFGAQDEGQSDLLSKMEGKRRAEIEEDARMADIKKKMQQDKNDVNQNAMWIQVREEQELSAKPELILPEPQVSDAELSDIIKLGKTGLNVRNIVDTEMLESDTLKTPMMMRTPGSLGPQDRARITTMGPPSVNESIRTEARNALRMEKMQTPLLGEENEPLSMVSGTGFEGITPRRKAVATPSVVGPFMSAAATPISARTPESAVSSTPGITRKSRKEERVLRNRLKMALASLPKPKNDFEIVEPDMPGLSRDDDGENDTAPCGGIIPDKSDMQVLAERQAERYRERCASLRSTVSKRGLPIPRHIPPCEVLVSRSTWERLPSIVRDMFKRELKILLEQDVNGAMFEPSVEDLEVDLERARGMVREEVRKMFGDVIQVEADMVKALEERDGGQLLEDVSRGEYVRPRTEKDRARLQRQLLERHRASVVQTSGRCNKVRDHLTKKTQGYVNLNGALRLRVQQAYETILEHQVALQTYQSAMEKEASTGRVMEAQARVKTAHKTAQEEQARYAALVERKKALLSRLEKMTEGPPPPDTRVKVSEA